MKSKIVIIDGVEYVPKESIAPTLERQDTKTYGRLTGTSGKKIEPQDTIQQKDWEIVAYSHDGYIYRKNSLGEFATALDAPIHKLLLHPVDMKIIHSVKRLSDNTVFTVGMDTSKGVINYIDTANGNIYFDCGEGYYKGAWRISDLSPKEEQPKPLFTTEDGHPVYLGKIYWKVTPLESCWKASETIMRNELANPPSYFKYFSTKEAAEQYIIENKPCLSVKEVSEAIVNFNLWDKRPAGNAPNADKVINNLKQLAQSKTNNPIQ